MAAVTRPGPADARVPCPLCGGLIHPIAGRCKHCKGDLRALRSARPAAVATLPALAQPTTAPYGNGHATAEASPRETNGHHTAPPGPPAQSLVQAVAAAAPIPLAIHPGPADAIAILPPRPTGRFTAPAPRASWKSWPVIVIVLAVIAIVTAVVLMVLPPGGARGAGAPGTNHTLQPAPERMDTSPTPPTPPPPSTSPDPWSRRGGRTAPPPPQVAPPDDPDIDDPDVDDALATRDPFSRRGRLGSLGSLGARSTNMLYSIVKQACSRLAACSSTNAQVKQICDLYTSIPSVTPPRCPAAARCLRSINEMSCDVAIDDPTSLLQLKDKFADCTDALRC
jgi:hypothetical protein